MAFDLARGRSLLVLTRKVSMEGSRVKLYWSGYWKEHREFGIFIAKESKNVAVLLKDVLQYASVIL